MSHKSHRKAERGQAIVLMAGIMIGMIAFIGLALDGGHFYDVRRQMQNAVDSAAWARADGKCYGPDSDAKALEMLKANGFDPAKPNVTASIAPLPYNAATMPPGTVSATDYEVKLTVVMKTFFLPVIRMDTLTTTVFAVARCIDMRIAVEKATLVALSTSCQFTMNLSGSNITIGGGTYSNNDYKADTSNGVIAEAFYVTSLQSNGVTWGDNPIQVAHPIADPGLFDPGDYDLGSPKAVAAGANYHFIDGDLTVNFNQGEDLSDGLWFITGSLKTVGNMTNSHKITVVALGTIQLSATNIVLEPYLDNLLLYSGAYTNCGTNAIKLSSKLTAWKGIMYAPYGGFSFSDSENSSTDGGIMAQTIDIHSSNTTITRNPGVTIQLPATTYLVA